MRLYFVYAVSILCLAHVSCVNVKDKRPNIVFVLADDYGYNDIGYHGSDIQTPNLDKLAAEGVKLENYYVQPVCTPTRSQLMSGRYQIHTGLQHHVLNAEQKNGLPLDSPTLADKILEAGYSTHMVGKWHLGFYNTSFVPWKRGFHTYFGYLSGSEDYYRHTRPYHGKGGIPYLDLRDQNGPVWNETGHYSAHLFTEKAVDVVNAHNTSSPLFLYLAYQSVHEPLEVPEKYLVKYQHVEDEKRRNYSGMVAAMDEGIGNLTQTLKERGLWENTILIFSTDNGANYHQGGNNWPLRGRKGSLWEGGLHGVGFVSGGAMKQRGVVNKQFIHVSDWFPTLVRLVHGNLKGTKPLDGFDQWDTIIKNVPSKRTTLLHNIDPLYPKAGGSPLYNDTFDTRVRAALRVGDMKLITGDPGQDKWVPPPGGSLRFVPEKPRPTNKNVWLFNITADPNEYKDLSDEMPHIVKDMLHQLDQINKTSVPCRFPRRDPRSNPALHGGVWGPWLDS